MAEATPTLMPGYLLLEDGTQFGGRICGAHPGAGVFGEVVFNTAMTGYQESVTDPSYRGQILTFTYPMVGNYGVDESAMESDSAQVRGVVMREAVDGFWRTAGADSQATGWLGWLEQQNVAALTGIDTRGLVRHLRDKGAMRGGIFDQSVSAESALDSILAQPTMTGSDLAREVTPSAPIMLGETNTGPLVVAIDTGIKRSISDHLVARGARLELHPCDTPATELLRRDADMFFLANGPGDPAALDYVVDTVRQLIGKRPIFGICLGHQLLCRAIGLDTYKLQFGHRGANHPVKDLTTGKIDITSQNHGFAVSGPGGVETISSDDPVRWTTEFGDAELSHINLYDRTVEGLILRDVPGATVQYHPEAGPGPHDALYLFDRFLAMAEAVS